MLKQAGGMVALAVVALAHATAIAAAEPTTPQQLLLRYKAQAQAAGIMPPEGFSAERGRAFYLARHAGGKPETPSCTTCHTESPRNAGRTRAGKVIEPLALSRSPQRFHDAKKVEKWFRRNCRSVLGRNCTPLEKGDFITFMMSQ